MSALACRELVELVTDYLEDALPPAERRSLEEHLDRCPGCRVYLEQLRVTIRLVGHLGPRDLAPDVEKALLDAFRELRRAS